MSHVVTVELDIPDLDGLDAACRMLGTAELVRGQQTYRWWGEFVGDDTAVKDVNTPEFMQQPQSQQNQQRAGW